jgi:hypothetical protein
MAQLKARPQSKQSGGANSQPDKDKESQPAKQIKLEHYNSAKTLVENASKGEI